MTDYAKRLAIRHSSSNSLGIAPVSNDQLADIFITEQDEWPLKWVLDRGVVVGHTSEPFLSLPAKGGITRGRRKVIVFPSANGHFNELVAAAIYLNASPFHPF